MFVQDIRVC